MADIPSTPADGNTRVLWVDTLANPDAPTAVEIESGEDFSCYLTSDGWAPGLDEQTISDERLCSVQTFERLGRYSRSLTVKYVENPGDAPNNLAFTTLVPRGEGFFVVRRGKAFDLPIVAADKVDVWPVQMGQYNPLPPEANSIFKVEQRTAVTAVVRQQVPVS